MNAMGTLTLEQTQSEIINTGHFSLRLLEVSAMVTWRGEPQMLQEICHDIISSPISGRTEYVGKILTSMTTLLIIHPGHL